MDKKKKANKLIKTLIIATIIFFMLIPIAIMISTSLKTYTEITLWPPKFIPDEIQWENYYEVIFGEKNIRRPFNNSLIVAITSSTICVLLGSFAAFGVTRYQFIGKKIFLFIIIFTQMFSAVILVNPMYIIFRDLGLLNTRISLIIANTASSLPMTVWLLYSYMSAIPVDMEEAAMVDGCNRMQAAKNILLPLIRPGMITAGLFAFISSWGDLIYVQTFITDPQLKTMSLALTDFQELYKTTWETQMAASVISIIPVFIIFLAIQKHLAKGVVGGGIKE